MADGMEFECPVCGPGVLLGPASGPFQALPCRRCGGALFAPRQAARLQQLAGPPTAVARPRPPLPCPSCGEAVSRMDLGGVPFAPCAGCGAAWVDDARRFMPADGVAARPLPAARPRPARGRVPVVVGTLAAAALLGSLAWLAGPTAIAALHAPKQPEGTPSAPALPPPAEPPAAGAATAPVPATSGSAAPAPAAPAAPGSAAPTPAAPEVAPLLLAPPVAVGPVEVYPSVPGQPRVILAPRDVQTATVVICFATGSADDALPGLTRVAQQALLAANARLDVRRLGMDLHAAGAAFHIATEQRDAWFMLTADRRDFAELAQRLLDAVLAPRFLPGRMAEATARGVLDAPGGMDALHLLTVVDMAADARFLNPDVAKPDEVEAIVAEDVEPVLSSRLSPANATVAFAGGFDRREVSLWMGRYRGGRAESKGRAQLVAPFSTRRSAPHEVHVLAFPLQIDDPGQAAAARVTVALLHDALWRTFRTRAVAYSFDVELIHRTWIDALMLSLAGNDPSSDLGAALREAVDRVREGKLDDRDFERARGAARGDLVAVDRDAPALALALARGGPSWQGPAVAEALDGLRRASLLENLQSWMVPERAIRLYLGPQP
jgi:predicted Zn-dependent peptidase